MSSINSYGYKPNPIFKTIHDEFTETSRVKDLLFGVELEIDKGDDAGYTSDELVEESEDIYCKHDGSLGHEGIEIVTYPATLEYHMEKLGWENLAKIARRHSYESHSARTCGLHIHVGRFQLGRDEVERDKTAGKIVILVSRFWEEMVQFSRRKKSQLDAWARLPMEDFGDVKEDVIDKALRTKDNGRYQAVNLQNWSTIEFRLFNGTLNMDTLKATLQLVSNICTYAKTHTVDEVLASQWEDIVNVQRYVELTLYLNEKGLSLVAPKEPIEFKFETDEAKYAYEEEQRRKREEERKKKLDAERKKKLEAMRRHGYHIGETIRIANANGYCISALERYIGKTAIITNICEGNTYDIEVMFPDTRENRAWFHYSDNKTKGIDAPLYYNVYYANIEKLDAVHEEATINTPMPSMA